jgi:hypothetical protein
MFEIAMLSNCSEIVGFIPVIYSSEFLNGIQVKVSANENSFLSSIILFK